MRTYFVLVKFIQVQNNCSLDQRKDSLVRFYFPERRPLSQSTCLTLQLVAWCTNFLDAFFWHSDFHASRVIKIDENGGLDCVKTH